MQELETKLCLQVNIDPMRPSVACGLHSLHEEVPWTMKEMDDTFPVLIPHLIWTTTFILEGSQPSTPATLLFALSLVNSPSAESQKYPKAINWR